MIKKTAALFSLITPFNEKYKNPTEMELEVVNTELSEHSAEQPTQSEEDVGEMIDSERLIFSNMFTEEYANMKLEELVTFCKHIYLKFEVEQTNRKCY